MNPRRTPRYSKSTRSILSIIPGGGISIKTIPTLSAGEERDKELNNALRIWKSKVRLSGILIEAKERREFLKPSVVKRKQRKDAIRQAKFDDIKIKST